jgi:cytochrome c oxidase assembly factor CtaG
LFGMSPLDDQQLAGLIMWVPGGALYLIAGLLLSGLWLSGVRKHNIATTRWSYQVAQ